MDPYEATQLVFARVQAQDPESVSKIIGYLLLQDRSEQEMARLAVGSDGLLQSTIARVKRELGIAEFNSGNAAVSAPPNLFQSEHHNHHLHHHHQQQQQQQRIAMERLNSRPSPLFIPDSPVVMGAASSPLNHHTNPQQNHHFHHSPMPLDEFDSPNGTSASSWLFNSEPFFKNSSRFYPAAANPPKRHLLQQMHHHPGSPQPQQLHDLIGCKPCLYYSRGYCKHGINCRFLHGSSSSSPSPSSPASSSSCNHCSSSSAAAAAAAASPFLIGAEEEDHCGSSSSPSAASSSSSSSSSSLEKLEMELQELLRGRRTPISIASLPQLYFEKFGKALQAQGYLTESQRHGKAGCSLTKLLARLKGSVALIDRPHGQHAVVLAEDAQRFVGYRADRDDLKDVNPSSRQIYLTFPAESTFTEEDVSQHFRAYGPVQDVRIPYQQKRMFGFVTFLYPETVKTILSEGNPHYICGARVLVKPYREKAKLSERKQVEKLDPLRIGPPPQFRSVSGKDFMQDGSLYDVFARRIEEERILELERRRMMEFHLRARAAEAEAEAAAAAAAAAAKLLMEEQERNSGPLLNGIHLSVDSPEVPGTPQISEHNIHVAKESTLTSEDMQQFQSSSPFGFVMDVLEGEIGDETDSPPAAAENKAPTAASLQQNGSNINITEPLKSNGHNLPDSPFASPHKHEKQPVSSEEQLPTSLQEKMMNLNLNEVLGGMASLPMSSSFSHNENNIICCICLQHCVEPSRLECSHTFCVQCILKVIRGSKDECPICRQHIGSQVYKILQNRDLQSWLSPTLSHRVPQHIW